MSFVVAAGPVCGRHDGWRPCFIFVCVLCDWATLYALWMKQTSWWQNLTTFLWVISPFFFFFPVLTDKVLTSVLNRCSGSLRSLDLCSAAQVLSEYSLTIIGKMKPVLLVILCCSSWFGKRLCMPPVVLGFRQSLKIWKMWGAIFQAWECLRKTVFMAKVWNQPQMSLGWESLVGKSATNV